MFFSLSSIDSEAASDLDREAVDHVDTDNQEEEINGQEYEYQYEDAGYDYTGPSM